MKNLLFTSFILCLSLLIGACNHNPDNQYDNPDVFFSQPRFKGEFFKSFSLLEADTIVAHIRTEVPRKWQGFACQGGFYNLQNVKNVTDSMLFRYLDVIEKEFPADSTRAFVNFARSDIFIKLVQYDTALACLNRAYDLCLQNGDDLMAASVVNGFAIVALRQNDYPKATQLYLRNYAYFSTLDTTAERGRMFDILKKLGRVYTQSQNLTEAHKWYLKIWEFTMTGPSRRQSFYPVESATLLAQSYIALNQLDSAQIMLDSATYFLKKGVRYHEEDLLVLLRAKVQLGKGNCRAALPLLWLAKAMIKNNTDRLKQPVYDKALADGYVCLGRLDSAIYFYKMALSVPDSLQQVAILGALSKAYILRGDYQQAYAYEQQSNDLRNRIFTSQKEQEVGRLHAQNELEKQERLLETQKSQMHLNRVWMLTGLCALALVLTIVLFRFYRKKKALQIAEQTQKLLRQEKQLAEAQTALHQKALVRAEQEIVVKDMALEESTKLLDVKNILIENLQMRLTENQPKAESLNAAQLGNLKILTTEDWHTFRKLVTQRFPSFFTHLSSRFPKLSPAETRLFLLIKIGFDSIEISDILGISPTSVYVSRSRLRKRLDLKEEDDLEQLIKRF